MKRKIRAIKVNAAATTIDARVWAELDDGSTLDLPCVRIEVIMDARTGETTSLVTLTQVGFADLDIDIPIEAAKVTVQS